MEADWLDSVIVCMDLLRTAQEDRGPKKKFSALRIFMFSELGCPSSTDQVSAVLTNYIPAFRVLIIPYKAGSCYEWNKDDGRP